MVAPTATAGGLRGAGRTAHRGGARGEGTSAAVAFVGRTCSSRARASCSFEAVHASDRTLAATAAATGYRRPCYRLLPRPDSTAKKPLQMATSLCAAFRTPNNEKSPAEAELFGTLRPADESWAILGSNQ